MNSEACLSALDIAALAAQFNLPAHVKQTLLDATKFTIQYEKNVLTVTAIVNRRKVVHKQLWRPK